MPLRKRLLLTVVSLTLAMLIWLPMVHLFFRPALRDYIEPTGIPPQTQALANRFLKIWTDPALQEAELAHIRSNNAEWDFMGRTYFVLALANMAERNPAAKNQYLSIMDKIIDQTVQTQTDAGMYHFLMPYALNKPYTIQPARSLFLDTEIAMMMAARRLVREKPEYREPMQERLAICMARMKLSPVLMAESYPDECWVFDHAMVLATIKMADSIDHQDHSQFCREWIESAKRNLIEPTTGLLVSYSTTRGVIGDGPEGTTLWNTTHFLSIVDHDFAFDQYQRAKDRLSHRLLGFAWASEWPAGLAGHDDVDSGPTIPLLNLSAGSSGLAFIGAGTFDDHEYTIELLTMLNLGGFPIHHDDELKFSAGNQVGDAVLLYSLVQGPLWDKIRK